MFSLDAIEVILDVQFNVAQRQDYTVAFVEPRSTRALHELAHLPGVLAVEPVRAVPARIRAGHRTRQTAITGSTNGSRLQRVVDTSLDARAAAPGWPRLVPEARRDAERRGRRHRARGAARRARGPSARSSSPRWWTSTWARRRTWTLRRCSASCGKAPTMSGASLLVDKGNPDELYRRIKATPAIAGVSSKRAAIDNFRNTIAQNMNVMIFFNVLFSSVIAFGVVYNAARISLSERSRELASLRVLGFTRAEISLHPPRRAWRHPARGGSGRAAARVCARRAGRDGVRHRAVPFSARDLAAHVRVRGGDDDRGGVDLRSCRFDGSSIGSTSSLC